MKRASIGTALIAVMAIGCSDSTGPSAADLVGTWIAASYVFTETADATQTIDVIALGMSLSITFTETSMSGTMTIPGFDPEAFTSTYTLDGDQITISDPTEDPETLTIVVTETTLTISGGEDTFDFNDDGQETAASYVMTFTKQ